MGSQTNLLAYDVHDNADVFYREVRGGSGGEQEVETFDLWRFDHLKKTRTETSEMQNIQKLKVHVPKCYNMLQ